MSTQRHHLTVPQRAMVEKIGSFRWTSLDRLDIRPTSATLLTLRMRGLAQLRTTKVTGQPTIYEVRLVATEQIMSEFESAVQALVDSLPPTVRRLLAPEVAAVQKHLNRNKEIING